MQFALLMFEQRLKEIRECALWIFGERTVKAEETGS